jgi:hypothetical protein
VAEQRDEQQHDREGQHDDTESLKPSDVLVDSLETLHPIYYYISKLNVAQLMIISYPNTHLLPFLPPLLIGSHNKYNSPKYYITLWIHSNINYPPTKNYQSSPNRSFRI